MYASQNGLVLTVPVDCPEIRRESTANRQGKRKTSSHKIITRNKSVSSTTSSDRSLRRLQEREKEDEEERRKGIASRLRPRKKKTKVDESEDDESELPDLSYIGCRAVARLRKGNQNLYTAFGPECYKGDKYLGLSMKTGQHLIIHETALDDGKDVSKFLTEVADYNPSMLPTDHTTVSVRTEDGWEELRCTVHKFCNAGTLLELYTHSRSSKKLPSPEFTCHIFIQILEALFSLAKAGVYRNDCSPENWFLDFPNQDLDCSPDVMLGNFATAEFFDHDDEPSKQTKDLKDILLKFKSWLPWFMGQVDEVLLEPPRRSVFDDLFYQWVVQATEECEALKIEQKHKNRRTRYEAFLLKIIGEGKTALFTARREKGLDLPVWMKIHFNDCFAKYPTPEPVGPVPIANDAPYPLNRSEELTFRNIGYEVRRVLGEGAFGSARLCRNANNGELAALKSQADASLEEEHDTLESLMPHPRIIRPIGVYEDTPRLNNIPLSWNVSKRTESYWTMAAEYCNGNSLGSFLDHVRKLRRSLPGPLRCHIYAHILEALIHCYRKGWHHGDLHQGNIFLRFKIEDIYAFPDVVLGDFGNAGIDTKVQYVRQEFYTLNEFCKETALYEDDETSLALRGWTNQLYKLAPSSDDISSEEGSGTRTNERTTSDSSNKSGGGNNAGDASFPCEVDAMESIYNEIQEYLKSEERGSLRLPDWIVPYLVEKSLS